MLIYAVPIKEDKWEAMTDKQSFLDRLGAALRLRGVSDADAAPYIERFEMYWERMAGETGETSQSLFDIESVADNITAQISQRTQEIDRFAEKTITMDAVSAYDEMPYEEENCEDTSYDEAFDESIIGYEAFDGEIADDTVAEAEEEEGLYDDCEAMYSDEAECLIPAEELVGVDHGEADAYMGEESRLPDYVEEEDVPATPTFRIITVASLPVTIPLALVYLSVFAAMWGGLAAIMLAAMAGVAALTAGGVAVSLVGIVYGVIQLFAGNVAVGVYEIGLGIIAAGLAMLASILLYNFAIRFIPWVMRQVYRLLKFTLAKLSELYNHLKKESAKL